MAKPKKRFITKAAKQQSVVEEREDDDLTDALIAATRKHFDGRDVVVKRMGDLDDGERRVSEFIATGLYWFDFVLSLGHGIPVGRMIELFGPEGSGKTALCEYLIARCQKTKDAVTDYLDFEHSLDFEHIVGYGADPSRVIYEDLETIEDGWDTLWCKLEVYSKRITDRVKKSKTADPPLLVMWDSVAGAPARAELKEDEHSDSHIGLAARAMAKGCRKLSGRIKRSRAVVVFINQIRDKIGMSGPGGPKTTTPGGRALKFFASLRLSLIPIKTIKNGKGQTTGQVVMVIPVKNRFAPRGAKAEFILSFNRGIDLHKSNIHFFKKFGFVKPAGPRMRFKGIEEPFKLSEWSTAEFQETNKEVIDAAVATIYAKMRKELELRKVDATDDDEDVDDDTDSDDTDDGVSADDE